MGQNRPKRLDKEDGAMKISEKIKDKINQFLGAEFERKRPNGVCLDLGCGKNKHEGCIGVDCKDFDSVDVICDFNEEKLPFESNYADEVFLVSVIEHLEDWISFLEEVYRICRNGAIIHIQVPHYRHKDAFTDPQHKHFFTMDTLDHLLDKEYHSFEADMEIIEKKKHRNIWFDVDGIMVDIRVVKNDSKGSGKDV